MHRSQRRCGALALALFAAGAAADEAAPEPELLEFIGEWRDDEVVLATDYPVEVHLPASEASGAWADRDDDAARGTQAGDDVDTEARRD